MTCLATWGFRTNPFEPERSVNDGASRSINLIRGPLKPNTDAAHLEFYFDLYAWKSERLNGIEPNGRLRVFTPDDTQMMTLLISGARGCGRTSLRNLLIYEIQHHAKEKPIVVDYEIALANDEKQNASGLADFLFDALEIVGVDTGPLQTMFWARFNRATPPTPAAIFASLKPKIRELLPEAPIVFVLDGSNSNVTADTAKTVCGMLRNIADYAILSVTDDEDAAHLTHHFTTTQRPVAWVDSPRVDEARMRAYLQARLGAERSAANPDMLHPFTDDALRELFAPGSNAKRDQRVTLPIKVALAKIAGAFSQKCSSWQTSDAAPFSITAADVQTYLGSEP